MRNKIRKLYKFPSFNYFERISEAQHKIGETEPGRSPELSTWKWEPGEIIAARAHRTDTKEKVTQRELPRSVESLLSLKLKRGRYTEDPK